MKNHIKLLKEKIEDADMVLIGIGEDFTALEKSSQKNVREKFEASYSNEEQWIMPYFDAKMAWEDSIRKAYCNLYELVNGKNYFVISMRIDDNILNKETGFSKEQIVTPCGGVQLLQCEENCQNKVYPIDAETADKLEQAWNLLIAGDSIPKMEGKKCPYCGGRLVFNNIKTEKYCENGYLPMWEKYTKWLQGTLNHKLCILELGVGMKYPSVIRWPFEKTAFFNKKACLFRIHSKLYQLTEELNGKGYSIQQKPVEFLQDTASIL